LQGLLNAVGNAALACGYESKALWAILNIAIFWNKFSIYYNILGKYSEIIMIFGFGKEKAIRKGTISLCVLSELLCALCVKRT
jgi:hypothetical protein